MTSLPWQLIRGPPVWTSPFIDLSLSWVQYNQHYTSSFYACRSRKCKKTLMTWMSFFAHLGSLRVKAAHKLLMKLTPAGKVNLSRWNWLVLNTLSHASCHFSISSSWRRDCEFESLIYFFILSFFLPFFLSVFSPFFFSFLLTFLSCA